MSPENIVIAAQIGASAVLFIAFWLFVGRGIFKTFLHVLEEREEKTVGFEKRAGIAREEAITLSGKIEQILRETRLQGILARDRMVSEAKSKSQELIDKAQRTSKDELEKARAEIAALRGQAQTELNTEVESLAKLVVSRITNQDFADRQVH